MKHTPGPWKSKGVGNVRHIIHATDTSTYGIAEVRVEAHDTFSDLDANARLIAAAPDLLEALKACADVISLKVFPIGETYEMAVEAIAKAEGGEA